mgnify:CR=1 FL=1
MVKSKKWAFAVTVMSCLAFSAIGTGSVDPGDEENMAFASIFRTVIFGVVGATVLDMTLKSTEAGFSVVPAPE